MATSWRFGRPVQRRSVRSLHNLLRSIGKSYLGIEDVSNVKGNIVRLEQLPMSKRFWLDYSLKLNAFVLRTTAIGLSGFCSI